MSSEQGPCKQRPKGACFWPVRFPLSFTAAARKKQGFGMSNVLMYDRVIVRSLIGSSYIV